jgi:hypothetical protein
MGLLLFFSSRSIMSGRDTRGAPWDLGGHNKSLDASGGSVFRIMTGPAMLD